jgi:GcrA cell cycle regulator
MSDTPWTEFTIAKLSKLWEEGISSAEIGRQLNVSKSAVVGKIHRLGLPGRISPIKPVQNRRNSSAAWPQPDHPRKTLSKLACQQWAPAMPGPTAEPVCEVLPGPSRAPMPEDNVGWELARSPKQCRWPLGDPQTSKFRFCDVPTRPGKSYCEAHARLAYVEIPFRRGVVGSAKTRTAT